MSSARGNMEAGGAGAGESAGPVPAGAEAGRIERVMAERESLLWGKIALKLMVGVPLTLLGPLVVAVVLTLFAWANGWGFNYFTLWFLLACAVMFPVAYRLVRKQGAEERSFFSEWMIERVSSDVELAEDLSYEQALARQQADTLNDYLAIPLKGPNEVYESWLLIQERRRLGEPLRRRALEIVQQLVRADKALPWVQLRKSDETLERLLEVLGYLHFTDWLEMSQDGKKIWLLSEARKALMAR